MSVKPPTEPDQCVATSASGARCKCWKYDNDDKYCYQHYHLSFIDKVVDFNNTKKET